MAQIGYCYGSEYHLLRFLGHHRKFLNMEINNQTRFKGNIEWFDYLINENRLSFDDEYKNIHFLKERDNFARIEENWKKFWPQKGNSQNWDGIFCHNDEIVLVEAKAHLKEIQQSCTAKVGPSKNKIIKAFKNTKDYFSIISQNDWLIKYYQLANRLAFLYFLDINSIRASILNIYFLNGYKKRSIEKHGNKEFIVLKEDKSVTHKADWKIEIKKEYEYLGIDNSIAKERIESVFIDCIKIMS